MHGASIDFYADVAKQLWHVELVPVVPVFHGPHVVCDGVTVFNICAEFCHIDHRWGAGIVFSWGRMDHRSDRTWGRRRWGPSRERTAGNLIRKPKCASATMSYRSKGGCHEDRTFVKGVRSWRGGAVLEIPAIG